VDILLISPDLTIQSRVAAAAERGGGPAPRVCGGPDLVDSSEAASCRLVLLDLSAPGLDAAEVVAALRERLPEAARIVAFGPHVQKAKLDAARAAGCDAVISRGQFDRDLDAILQN
jgi:CheY-like chemotaxis protein